MRRIIILIPLLLLCLASALFAKPVPLNLKAKPECKVILVAVMSDTDTSFKNALIDSLRSSYEPAYQVKKVVIKKAHELQNTDFRVLIVMDQLKAWLAFNGQSKAIEKAAADKNIIYFMTAGDAKWKWKNKDIYHIASASEKTRLPKAWIELRTKIDSLLK